MFPKLSLWTYLGVTLLLMHITVQAVSIYLHRHQTHRSVGEMHPLLSHFYRAWLFLTTGMITKEWVAVHRKHHSATDTFGDPHSPRLEGLAKVFFGGTYLYRREAGKKETLWKFGTGTPNDWLEHFIYSRYSFLGPVVMLCADILFFGVPGLYIWGAQMIAIPGLGAGVINGLGHAWGYRNYDTPDVSRNILPIGIIVGGEELHNNHHAFQQSAKFSVRAWEFDLSWGYIFLFKKLGLVKKVRIAQRKH